MTGNHVSHDGGGLHNNGTLALLDNSIVAHNSAGVGGGGIINDGVLTLTNSLVEINEAGGSGGGILTLINTSQTTLQAGATVTGNTAHDGGGIFVFAGTVTLQPGSSVTENKATAGGGVNGSAVVQASGIVVDNTLLDGTTINNCQPARPNCPTNTN